MYSERFFVQGEPEPKGSIMAMIFVRGPKGCRRVVKLTPEVLASVGSPWEAKALALPDNSRSKTWERAVKLVASRCAPETPLDVPMGITIDFIMAEPKKARFTYPATKPDWDKLSRSTCDALTGLIYTDDSRIVKATVSEAYGDTPGAIISVGEVA